MPENPAALHVVGRTADGMVRHTIRSPTGWTPVGNVLAQAGRLDLEGLGEVVDVAAGRRVEPALKGQPEASTWCSPSTTPVRFSYSATSVSTGPTTSSSTRTSRSSAPTRALALVTPRAGVGSSTRRPQH